MPVQVVAEAVVKCSFGVAPTPLQVIPEGAMVTAGGLPAATIANMIPLVNIPTFGMCTTLSNPEVAAATTAALGVLTPMPCLPVIVDPWAPGAVSVTINGIPALTNDSVCMCAWGGEVSVVEPGQVMVEST
jgi:hypothetical protein